MFERGNIYWRNERGPKEKTYLNFFKGFEYEAAADDDEAIVAA